MSAIVGIAGGPNVLGGKPVVEGLHPLFFHDSASAIVVDGVVRAAIEEERLTRLKHTNFFPSSSLRACVKAAQIVPNEIEAFSFFFDEEFCNRDLSRVCSETGVARPPGIREILASNIGSALEFSCDPSKIRFVRHHNAHSRSALSISCFENALSVVVDGNGENEAVTIFEVHGNKQTLIDTLPVELSPGYFYREVTNLLGFGNFDEYKVMGLAPYGDPYRYEELFSSVKVALGNGLWGFDSCKLKEISSRALLVPGAEFTFDQAHRDFAAAAQRLLESFMLELLKHYQLSTGIRNLCISGGVAQNCAMNGVVARSGLFDSVYVYPVSGDAGTSIGAAIESCDSKPKRSSLFNSLLGRGISTNGECEEEEAALAPWSGFLFWYRPKNIHRTIAEALADGKIMGWARNRSEFGPRALGARSILADPRNVENRHIVNEIVKKRENFRPFAPSVLEEEAAEVFDLPTAKCNLGQMNFIVPVRPEWQSKIGAVVHIDGTARVQVVAKDESPDYWRLIDQFRLETKVGVLLNTSFNNSYEPIVDSPVDAVRSFITTDLDLLVLGPFLVTKVRCPREYLKSFRLVGLNAGVIISEKKGCSDKVPFKISRGELCESISPSLAYILKSTVGRPVIEELFVSLDTELDHDTLLEELWMLWEKRFIEITGPSAD